MNTSKPPWRGEYGEGPDAWEAVIDEAIDANDGSRTPHRLAEILLANDPNLTRRRGHHIAGLPPGKAGHTQVRAVAAAMEGWVDADPPEAAVWAVLARLDRVRKPQEGTPESAHEIHAYMNDHHDAVTLAREVGDPLLLALALLRLAISSRNAYEHPRAADAAREAARLTAGDVWNTEPPSHLNLAVGSATWLPSEYETALTLHWRAHSRAGNALRMGRDYPGTILARDQQIEAARKLVTVNPMLLSQALGERSNLARNLGDITTAIAVHTEHRMHAQRFSAPDIQQRYLLSAHSFARYLDDWEGARAVRLERLRSWIEDVVSIPPGAEVTPHLALAAVEAHRAQADLTARTAMGNDAYELGSDLIDSGMALADPSRLAEVEAWFEVAETAWDDFGLNGKVAVGFRRLQVAAISGRAGDAREVGRAMVDFSRRWRRSLGQRRAALEAVRWGEPGDEVVLGRLEELRTDAPPVDAAFLDLGIANWLLNAGDAAHAAADAAAAQEYWGQAIERAMAAASGLALPREQGPPFLLNPAAYIEALQTHAHTLARLRTSTPPTDAAADIDQVDAAALAVQELAVRVSSLPAIAQRLSTAGTPFQRGVLDRLYSTWLADTAELAVTLGDGHAADTVAEVQRRDLVGTILLGLSNDPDVPQQIAALARQLVATLAATATDTDTGDHRDMDMRAGSIGGQLASVLDVTGQVVGPVAKTLFDPRNIAEATTINVLRALHPTAPAAVLSLLLLTTGPTPRLLRHLAWTTNDHSTPLEYLDIIDAPHWLPGLTAEHDPDLLPYRLTRLTHTLLPPPLLQLLTHTTIDPDYPLHLTIIPTGLLAIPFTALPLTDRHLLVDLAIVTTVQSLHTALTLAHTTPHTPTHDSPTPGNLAIYDFTRLTHTQTEYDKLHEHHGEPTTLNSLADLDAALNNPNLPHQPGMLALAIHGTRGHDGWSQTKTLPNGDTLTTGHILQWHLPRHIVAGSCNTSIRTDTGGELGGFPLAFQLRGATTIIGTLHDIEDQSTAAIIGLYYAALTANHTPASALRQAQRTWINQNRTTRLTHTHQWAYLTTYGTPG